MINLYDFDRFALHFSKTNIDIYIFASLFSMDRVIQYRLIKLRNFSGFIFIFNMASIPTVDELKKLKVVELKQKLSELELPVQGACLLHLFYETKHFVFSTLMYKSPTRVSKHYIDIVFGSKQKSFEVMTGLIIARFSV
jgi:hypothetical protein